VCGEAFHLHRQLGKSGKAIKIYVMHLDIDEILYYKDKPKKQVINTPQHRLYNLLFTGKINMKEYLAALRDAKDGTGKEE
jgi:hypothetical protein